MDVSTHFDVQVLERADFTIPVEIEGQYHNIYVIKRPGVDQFMKRVGELYEVVVFTASVSKVSLIITLVWSCLPLADSSCYSMVTRCLTNLTFTTWFTIGYSERAATITKATMSRSVLQPSRFKVKNPLTAPN